MQACQNELLQSSAAFMSIAEPTSRGSRRKKTLPFNPVRYLALVLSEKAREKNEIKRIEAERIAAEQELLR
jgi:hypothetical protein